MNNLLMKDQHVFLNQLIVLLRSNLAGKYIKTGAMIGALLSLDNATAGEVALEYSSEEIFEVLNWGYKNRGIRLSGLIQAGMDLIGNKERDRLKIMCYLSFLLKPRTLGKLKKDIIQLLKCEGVSIVLKKDADLGNLYEELI